MAQCQAKRQKLENYISTRVQSQAQSKKLMKKLLCSAVSYLAKNRMRLPDEYFIERNVGDLKIPILCPENCNQSGASISAKMLVTWLKSIFEGLDNIRAIVFGFYREKGSPSTLFESYKFTIKEKHHSNQIWLWSANQRRPFFAVEGDFLKGCNIELENSNGRISEVTQNATRLEVQIKDLLSEFECINNELKPLPEECFVTMRLVYNKDTPEKYNPEGFVTDEKGDMSVSNQGEFKSWVQFAHFGPFLSRFLANSYHKMMEFSYLL